MFVASGIAASNYKLKTLIPTEFVKYGGCKFVDSSLVAFGNVKIEEYDANDSDASGSKQRIDNARSGQAIFAGTPFVVDVGYGTTN